MCVGASGRSRNQGESMSTEGNATPGPWIATRANLTAKDGRRVEVSMSAPVQLATDDWICEFELVIDGEPARGRASGMDSFQAMQMCLFVIWRKLTDLDCTFANEPRLEKFRDHGVYRTVPMNVLMQDVEKVHAFLDAEAEKMTEDPEKLALLRVVPRE